MKSVKRPARALVETPGLLRDAARDALREGAPLARMKKAFERASPVPEHFLSLAAELGSPGALRLVMSHLAKPASEEERASREAALWSALAAGAERAPCCKIIAKELGLPRARLSKGERFVMELALRNSTMGDGASLELMLDWVKPAAGSEAARETLMMAARWGGGGNVRRLLEHPQHGPRIDREMAGAALRDALDNGDGQLLLEALRALAPRSFLGAPKGGGPSVLGSAAAGGALDCVEWLLSRTRELSIGEEDLRDSAQRARSSGRKAAADLIESALARLSETAVLEECVAAIPAKRARGPKRV